MNQDSKGSKIFGSQLFKKEVDDDFSELKKIFKFIPSIDMVFSQDDIDEINAYFKKYNNIIVYNSDIRKDLSNNYKLIEQLFLMIFTFNNLGSNAMNINSTRVENKKRSSKKLETVNLNSNIGNNKQNSINTVNSTLKLETTKTSRLSTDELNKVKETFILKFLVFLNNLMMENELSVKIQFLNMFFKGKHYTIFSSTILNSCGNLKILRVILGIIYYLFFHNNQNIENISISNLGFMINLLVNFHPDELKEEVKNAESGSIRDINDWIIIIFEHIILNSECYSLFLNEKTTESILKEYCLFGKIYHCLSPIQQQVYLEIIRDVVELKKSSNEITFSENFVLSIFRILNQTLETSVKTLKGYHSKDKENYKTSSLVSEIFNLYLFNYHKWNNKSELKSSSSTKSLQVSDDKEIDLSNTTNMNSIIENTFNEENNEEIPIKNVKNEQKEIKSLSMPKYVSIQSSGYYIKHKKKEKNPFEYSDKEKSFNELLLLSDILAIICTNEEMIKIFEKIKAISKIEKTKKNENEGISMDTSQKRLSGNTSNFNVKSKTRLSEKEKEKSQDKNVLNKLNDIFSAENVEYVIKSLIDLLHMSDFYYDKFFARNKATSKNQTHEESFKKNLMSEKFILFGFQTNIFKIMSNFCYKNSNSINFFEKNISDYYYILNHMKIDKCNPFKKEWSVLLTKCVAEKSTSLQEAIENLKPFQIDPMTKEFLEKKGYKIEIEKGYSKPKIEKVELEETQ